MYIKHSYNTVIYSNTELYGMKLSEDCFKLYVHFLNILFNKYKNLHGIFAYIEIIRIEWSFKFRVVSINKLKTQKPLLSLST